MPYKRANEIVNESKHCQGKPILHYESTKSSNPTSDPTPLGAPNHATTLLRVAHKVSKVSELNKSLKALRTSTKCKGRKQHKATLVLATKEPNSNVSWASRRQTVKQGVSPAGKRLVNSSRPVKRGGSSHTSYGCHRVSKQAARRSWRPRLPSNGTRPQCKTSVFVVDNCGTDAKLLCELVKRHVCTDP